MPGLTTQHTSCEISSVFFDFTVVVVSYTSSFPLFEGEPVSFPGSLCYKESHGYETKELSLYTIETFGNVMISCHGDQGSPQHTVDQIISCTSHPAYTVTMGTRNGC